MSDVAELLKAYAEKYSVEQENLYVEEKCKTTCMNSGGSRSRCQPVQSYGIAYKTPAPLTGKTRFDGKPEEQDFRCWSVLPPLEIGREPYDLLKGAAAEEAMNESCLKCRREARMKFQLAGAVQPDAKFWVGLGLMGAGVLLAVVLKAARR